MADDDHDAAVDGRVVGNVRRRALRGSGQAELPGRRRKDGAGPTAGRAPIPRLVPDFLAAVVAVGTPRDYAVAALLPEFFVIGPGVGPALADAACWAGTLALAQAVMRLVAGPARGDSLARSAPQAEPGFLS